MTMDYGAFFSAGRRMGDLAVSAATDEIPQLQRIFGVSADAAAAMVGITPMLGINDVTSEVFGLDDARTVVAFAKQRKIGLLSFWAINRDQQCAVVQIANCSGVNSANFQFNDIFSAR
jgi:chitinase